MKIDLKSKLVPQRHTGPVSAMVFLSSQVKLNRPHLSRPLSGSCLLAICKSLEKVIEDLLKWHEIIQSPRREPEGIDEGTVSPLAA